MEDFLNKRLLGGGGGGVATVLIGGRDSEGLDTKLLSTEDLRNFNLRDVERE